MSLYEVWCESDFPFGGKPGDQPHDTETVDAGDVEEAAEKYAAKLHEDGNDPEDIGPKVIIKDMDGTLWDVEIGTDYSVSFFAVYIAQERKTDETGTPQTE